MTHCDMCGEKTRDAVPVRVSREHFERYCASCAAPGSADVEVCDWCGERYDGGEYGAAWHFDVEIHPCCRGCEAKAVAKRRREREEAR